MSLTSATSAAAAQNTPQQRELRLAERRRSPISILHVDEQHCVLAFLGLREIVQSIVPLSKEWFTAAVSQPSLQVTSNLKSNLRDTVHTIALSPLRHHIASLSMTEDNEQFHNEQLDSIVHLLAPRFSHLSNLALNLTIGPFLPKEFDFPVHLQQLVVRIHVPAIVNVDVATLLRRTIRGICTVAALTKLVIIVKIDNDIPAMTHEFSSFLAPIKHNLTQLSFFTFHVAHLHTSHNLMCQEDAAVVASLPALTTLYDCTFSHQNFRVLSTSALCRTQLLRFDVDRIDEYQFTMLLHFKALTQLSIRFLKVFNISKLATLDKLKQLQLICHISVDIRSVVNSVSSLELTCLDLTHPQLDVTHLISIWKSQLTLTTLKLYHNPALCTLSFLSALPSHAHRLAKFRFHIGQDGNRLPIQEIVHLIHLASVGDLNLCSLFTPSIDQGHVALLHAHLPHLKTIA